MHTFKNVYVHLRVEGIEPPSVGLEPTMITITPYPLHNSFIVSYFARPRKITMRVTITPYGSKIPGHYMYVK